MSGKYLDAMAEIEVEVVGGSPSAIFDSPSPAEGYSKQVGDGVEVEYKSDMMAKSIEGEAFLFVIRQASDFGEFAVDAALWELLKRSGADVVRIGGERVKVKKEKVQERVNEILEQD
ncbi:hypothetical protein GCM10009000_108420 [Halobacterium noricense]